MAGAAFIFRKSTLCAALRGEVAAELRRTGIGRGLESDLYRRATTRVGRDRIAADEGPACETSERPQHAPVCTAEVRRLHTCQSFLQKSRA